MSKLAPKNVFSTINNIADEIMKLHELKEKGILTEEEFTDQRNNKAIALRYRQEKDY